MAVVGLFGVFLLKARGLLKHLFSCCFSSRLQLAKAEPAAILATGKFPCMFRAGQCSRRAAGPAGALRRAPGGWGGWGLGTVCRGLWGLVVPFFKFNFRDQSG